MSQFKKYKQQLIINEEQSSKILKDIMMGLSHMHDKDYIHRDLKPENILIKKKLDSNAQHHRDYYTAKIADFGLSAEYKVNINSEGTSIVEKMGTILFMAPEQA